MGINQKILDAITAQNNHIASGYTPHGLPHDYSWYEKGSGMVGYKNSPGGFTAMTGWFHLYPQEGQPSPSTSSRFYIRKWRVDLHKRSGGWIEGTYYGKPEFFSGSMFSAVMTPANPAQPGWAKAPGPEPDSTQLVSPLHGAMNHTWTQSRVLYPVDSVNGVLFYCDFKNDNSGAKIITQCGADWWRDAGAPFKSDFSNNPGVGTNDWEPVTPDGWKTCYYTNINPEQLAADPPQLLLTTGPDPEPPQPSTDKYLKVEVDGKPLTTGQKVTFIIP